MLPVPQNETQHELVEVARPVATCAGRNLPTQQQAAADQPHSTLSVLVVEPSHCQRLLRAAELECMGYRAYPVEDPRAAKSILVREKIDVVLMDWELPDPGALSFVAELCNDPRHTALVTFVLDTRLCRKRRDAARAAGASDLLEKTLSLERLRERIESSRNRDRPTLVEKETSSKATARDRNALMDRIEAEFEQGTGPLSLLLFRMDDLMDFKIDHGPRSASKLMTQMIDFVESSVRGRDFVARHTGSEIAVLLPETGRDKAASVLHRIQTSVDSRSWGQAEDACFVGISWGVATLDSSGQECPLDLITACVRSMLDGLVAVRSG